MVAVIVCKVPIPQIIAAVEQGLRQASVGSAERVRHKVIGVLGGAKPPPSNVTLDERLALKELRQDENIMILPADKGRATVLLDTSEYENKMSVLLSDMSTYKVLTRDPTPALQRKMNGVILKLKKENRITPKVYNRLTLWGP